MAAPPSHKLIPGCGFLVDGFRHAGHPSVKAFFLSHAHSDHYVGLKEDWNRGPIYCSEVTARLVAHMLGVGHQWLHPLPLDTPTLIQGVEVTLVTANHCPGAVQFLFRLPDGRRFVHTGDMRFSAALLDNPHLQRFRGCDALFLDTTYCNPRFCFPPQEESIEYVASTIQALLGEDAERQAQREGPAGLQGRHEGQLSSEDEGAGPSASAGQRQSAFRRLYLISTYGIGKEKILTAVHDRCGVRLHVADRKHGVMQQLDLPGYDPAQLFTTDPRDSPVHVVDWKFLGETWPYFRPNFVNPEQLRQDLAADEVVGFVPTGWLFEMRKEKFAVRSKGACSVHLVPYSEHSSFAELLEYVRFLRPHQVVPTVGVNGEEGNRERDKMLRHFRGLVDETASKEKFLAPFRRAAATEPAGDKEESLQEDLEDTEEGPMVDEQGQEEAGQSAGVIDLVEEDGGDADVGGAAGRSNANAADVAPLAPACMYSAAATVEAAGPPAAPLAAAPGPVAASPPVEDEGGAGPSEPALQQLLAVLGEEVSKQQARQLLAAAGGDLQAALNGFYDGLATAAAGSSGGGTAAAPDALASPAPPPSSTANGAKSGDGSAFAGTKRPAAAPAAKPKGRGGSKKQKAAAAAASPGQKSITAFFGRPQATPQQQQEQQQQQGEPQGGVQAPASALGAAAGGSDAMDDDLALTLNVPLAESSSAGAGTAAVAASTEAAVAGGTPAAREMSAAAAGAEEGAAETGTVAASPKPKLKLPPPPSPGTAAAPQSASSSPFFLSRASGRGGAKDGSGGGTTGGTARGAAVPRDALVLPLEKYDPVAHACWEPGQPTPYLHLARAFELMHSTTKRLRISDVLVNCFRSVLALCPTEELVQAAYLATGRIAPDYEPTELRVGGKIMTAAIIEATGVSKARLSEMYKDMGDVGDVVQACKQNQAVLQRPQPLTVPGVFAALQQIADVKGDGAQKRRQRIVLSLLRACREQEPKFMARTLVQNLRVGANWRSVIPALAKAVVMHKEGGRVPKARLDQAAAAATAAFHVCPNLQLLIGTMLDHPLEEWQRRCQLTPGMPIKPMLAKICEGLDDALEQLKGAPFLAEFKYDGMRAQIHIMQGGQVRIFSRNCEDQSARFPDAAQQILEAAQGGATSAIIDAELVAVDRGDGNRLRAFQELATRKKVDVDLDEVSVHVCIFVFDLLFRDGISLVHLPLEQRRQELVQALPNMQPGRCALAQSLRFPGGTGAPALATAAEVAATAVAGQAPEIKEEQEQPVGGSGSGQKREEAGKREADRAGISGQQLQVAGAAPLEDRLQECLLQAFAAGTEGLMLKSLTTAYEPSKRSDHWIKVKRDYCEGLHDTLDLVVIGAWYGNGRKAGWFSPYLLACYDPDTEQLQSVCRCMSGFTDAFYRESKERLSQTIIPGPKPYYNTGERPDMWFEPKEVWEIRGADLSLSPVHKAAEGRVHADRGLGLRFPRFLGRVREDKAPEDATSAEQIAEMYRAQTRKVESAGQRLEGGKQQHLQGQSASAEAAVDSEGEKEAGGTDVDEEMDFRNEER